MKNLWVFTVFLCLVWGSACTPSAQSPSTSGGIAVEPSALSKRGRLVYQTSCTACHNADPKLPGTVGPEVFGASLELLEARILRAEYPAGYAAKRPTKMMTALPHLKGDLPALEAYLSGK